MVERKLWGFTLTLGYSRMMMAEAALDQTLGTLLRMHEEAFRQLGGVPEEILYDRMKTVWQETDERGETVWNPVFLDFPAIGDLGVETFGDPLFLGYATTFCDLGKHRVFDVVLGRSEPALEAWLKRLQDRRHVRVVCVDLPAVYRALVRKDFPNARIVADRFHVIRLVNHHFLAAWRGIDPAGSKHRGLRNLIPRDPRNLRPTSKRGTGFSCTNTAPENSAQDRFPSPLRAIDELRRAGLPHSLWGHVHRYDGKRDGQHLGVVEGRRVPKPLHHLLRACNLKNFTHSVLNRTSSAVEATFPEGSTSAYGHCRRCLKNEERRSIQVTENTVRSGRQMSPLPWRNDIDVPVATHPSFSNRIRTNAASVIMITAPTNTRRRMRMVARYHETARRSAIT